MTHVNDPRANPVAPPHVFVDYSPRRTSMNDAIVKAWRDPYFREREAPAAAVLPHPSGEVARTALDQTYGGSDDGSFLICPSSWFICPSPTATDPFCQTLDTYSFNCCCTTAGGPYCP
jgi:hypothetical protein